MSSLSSLVAASAERRARNLEILAAMTARLDHIDFTPSEADQPTSRSTRPPMPTDGSAEADPRDSIPRRTTHGGPYGAAILDRVLASYGR
jgi:hypothetical protein